MRQAVFHRHRMRASYRNMPMDFVLGLLEEQDDDFDAAEAVPRRELRRRLRQEGRR